ncbi:unnamed protein product [Penicillium olsonii]|nr:unnamed protein product [Penicillium olsonii]
METTEVFVDSYAVLGVAQDASIKDINAAYKRLALRFHPDKAGSHAEAITQFQNLQDAVEILRDPSRRRDLDRTLDSRGNRHRNLYASNNRSYHDRNAETHQFSSKRQRGKYGFASRNRGQQKPPYSKKEFDDLLRRQEQWQQSSYNSGTSRYTYSYGHSVHMDPESEESKATRARYHAENVQWEREWAGIDSEVEKARAESRKEAMRARVARDMAQMEVDEVEAKRESPPVDSPAKPIVDPLNTAIDNAVNGIQLCAGFWNYANGLAPHPEENVKKGFSHAFGGFEHYKLVKEPVIMDNKPQDSKLGDSKEIPATSEAPTNPLAFAGFEHYKHVKEPVIMDNKPQDSKLGDSKGIPAPSEVPISPLAFAGNLPTTPSFDSSSVINSSVKSHQASERPISPIVSEPSTSFYSAKDDSTDQAPLHASLDANTTAQKLVNAYVVGHESTLDHLVPLFEQKLADPLGRYLINDLASELNGLVLESYSSWLEDVRLSIPGASPATARATSEACSHLGGWYKGYGRDQCDNCHFWKPLYVLTCAGCGTKSCIRCKFVFDHH